MNRKEQTFHQFLRPLKGIGLPINYDVPEFPLYESEFAYDRTKNKFLFSIELNEGKEDYRWITISRSKTIVTVTDNEYYIDNDDYLILAKPVEDEIIIYLQDAGISKENEYHIKRVSPTNAQSFNADVVTVKTTVEGQTIDGASEVTLSIANESIKVISDGENWFII